MSPLNHGSALIICLVALVALLTNTVVSSLPLAHKRLETLDSTSEDVRETTAEEEQTSQGIHEQIELPSDMGSQKIVDSVPFKTDSHDPHDVRADFESHPEDARPSPSTSSPPPEAATTVLPTDSDPTNQSAVEIKIAATEESIVDVVRISTTMETTTASLPSTTITLNSSEVLESERNVQTIVTTTPATVETTTTATTIASDSPSATALPEFLNRLTNLTLDVSKESTTDGEKEHRQDAFVKVEPETEEVEGRAATTTTPAAPTEIVTTMELRSESIEKPTFQIQPKTTAEPSQNVTTTAKASTAETATTIETIISDLPTVIPSAAPSEEPETTAIMSTSAPSSSTTTSTTSAPSQSSPSSVTSGPRKTDYSDIDEITLFDKILAGLRCSMRDCAGVLKPTAPPPRRVLKEFTIIRKARRNYMSCECMKSTASPLHA